MNWCWIKGHKWKIIFIHNYIDISDISDPSEGHMSNIITLQCDQCGNIKCKLNVGYGHVYLRNEDEKSS